MFKEGLALAGVYLMVVAVLFGGFLLARTIIFPAEAGAYTVERSSDYIIYAVTTFSNQPSGSGGSLYSGIYSTTTATGTALRINPNYTTGGSGVNYMYAWHDWRKNAPIFSTSTPIAYAYSASNCGASALVFGLSSTTLPNSASDYQSLSNSVYNAGTTTYNVGANGAPYALGIRAGQKQGCDLYVYYIRNASTSENYLVSYAEAIPTSTPSGGGSIINITDNGMITSEWTCTTDGDETVCEATATSSVRQYDGPTYYEWLLVAGVILFVLLYMLWPRLSVLKFNK